MKARIAVAVSGSGRSLKNFLRCQRHHQFEVAGVIASSRRCGAVKIAEDHSLPLFVGDFVGRDLSGDLLEWLGKHEIRWIALAGFLKKFPLLSGWEQRVVNIHPALLPAFGGQGMYGARVHAAVIAAGEQRSGATIHFVNDVYDNGQLLAQTQVSVTPGATAEQLAADVFAAECQLYPAALDDLILGKLPDARGVKVYEF